MKPKKIIKKLEKICNTTNNCAACPFAVYYEWYDGYKLECLIRVTAPPYYKQTIKKSKKYINKKIREGKPC